MTRTAQSAVQNRLLRALSPEDFDLLFLTSVSLPLRQTLFRPKANIEDLYFMERGFASITADVSRAQVEVGMIGREGLVGASPVLLGADHSPYHCYIQMQGEALRISKLDLLEAAGKSPSLHRLLMRYIQTLMVQTAQTAFANAACTIESRLARWILMCRDRSDSDELPFTHEFLSIMLGVRRPGITVVMQILEGRGLIRATRARIKVLDRVGLEAIAGEGYGLAETEYADLIDSHQCLATAA